MTTDRILAQLPSLRALVIGDICLDRWCRYDPSLAEPSRETGIPRTAVTATEVTPGAGGTVANNLAALGVGEVAVAGVIGDDGFGYELRHALNRRRISSDLVVVSPRVHTFTYTKLLNQATGQEDLPRVDFINTQPLPRRDEEQFIELIRESFTGFDAVLISDQAETGCGGVVTPAVRETIAELAQSHPGTIIWADSRRRIEHFRGIHIKPNEDEAAEALARLGAGATLASLRAHGNAPALFVTHGGAGITIETAAGRDFVETTRVANPVDICGAGDSFSAGAAMALAAGAPARAAALFGHRVASVTIMKKGTGTASPQELAEP